MAATKSKQVQQGTAARARDVLRRETGLLVCRETHLLDLGDVADERLVVDELQQLLQLVEVTYEVLSDFLTNTRTSRRELPCPIGSRTVPLITVSVISERLCQVSIINMSSTSIPLHFSSLFYSATIALLFYHVSPFLYRDFLASPFLFTTLLYSHRIVALSFISFTSLMSQFCPEGVTGPRTRI